MNIHNSIKSFTPLIISKTINKNYKKTEQKIYIAKFVNSLNKSYSKLVKEINVSYMSFYSTVKAWSYFPSQFYRCLTVKDIHIF